jgi:hypothetical protein
VLRKKYNKLYHENGNYEEKIKYFQQLMTEMEIDIENAGVRHGLLTKELTHLEKLLGEKDRVIFN